MNLSHSSALCPGYLACLIKKMDPQFMGEAGAGRSGNPTGGAGWIVRREWAERVGFQVLQKGQREVVISVGEGEARVKMASIYSQKCGDVKVGKENGKVVMGDTNDELRGGGGQKAVGKCFCES